MFFWLSGVLYRIGRYDVTVLFSKCVFHFINDSSKLVVAVKAVIYTQRIEDESKDARNSE
jgi:hypothetical protein